MVVKLMNSAMMPTRKNRCCKRLGEDSKILVQATRVESYIGYSDTAKYMK